MIVADWLQKGIAHLESKGVSEAKANAEFLLAHVLKVSRGDVALQSQRAISDKMGNHFWNLVHERGRRVPLAYVLGTQPFYGLELDVSTQALIPRPETEEVVGAAVRLLEPRKNEDLHVVEIGTGTGCIALALASQLPQAIIYATEISPAALQLAERNALKTGLIRRLRLVREDLFKPAAAPKGWADLVISNPPYIPSKDVDELEPEVLKEPRLALDGGPDGLSAIRALVSQAPALLKPGGWLVLEIGWDQGKALLKLFNEQGLDGGAVMRDAQGRDRIAVARRRA